MKKFNCSYLWLLAVPFLLSSCATTRQARDTKASAFLGDAAELLQPGKEGEALLRYVNPNVDFKKYHAVIIEPVTYWVGAGEKDGLTEEERKALTNYLDAQLREQIGKIDTVVDVNSQTDAIRFSAALIKADKSWPALATVATVVPMALAVSTLKTIVTGKPSFVGDIRGEMKATDSVTGELLGAASDKRVQGMAWKGKFNRWEAVESSSRFWAQLAAYKLCSLQGKSNCQKPTE